MNSSRGGDGAVEARRRIGRVWAGISAECRKSEKMRRRYGIGNGVRADRIREGEEEGRRAIVDEFRTGGC